MPATVPNGQGMRALQVARKPPYSFFNFPALQNFDLAHVPKLLNGLKAVKDGVSDLRIVYQGQSVPQAFRSNSAIATVQDQYGNIATQAYSYVVASTLASSLGIVARTSAWFGDAAGSTSTTTTQGNNASTARWRSDTRMTAYTAGTGNWIGQSGARLGGNRLRNIASTNKIRFTDTLAVDTVETYYDLISGGGTMSVGANNGAAIANQSVAGTDGTPAKLVTALGSLAVQSADAWRSAGSVDVSGQIIYNSTIKQAIMINAARQGSLITDWTGAAPMAQLDLIGPQVVFMQIDLNEWLGNIPPETFRVNYQSWISLTLALSSAPNIVLVISSTPDPATVRAYPWSDYRQVIYDLAAANNLALIDWGQCIDYSYANAVAANFIQPLDGLHWLTSFHTFAGQQLGNQIAKLVPA